MTAVAAASALTDDLLALLAHARNRPVPPCRRRSVSVIGVAPSALVWQSADSSPCIP
jgi:hypothetical protein